MKNKTFTVNILNIRDEEADYYLEKFTKNSDPTKFALIKISDRCIEYHLESVVKDLAELQEMKLTPTVIFGWADLVTKELIKRGIEPVFLDANRYTDDKVLIVIKEVIADVMQKIEKYAKKYKLKFSDLTQEKIFEAEKIDEKYGYIGKIVSVNTTPIEEAEKKGLIPLFAPLGFSGEQLYNLSSDEAARKLIESMNPGKVIFLTDAGAVLDKDGKPIDKLSILDDYDNLISTGTVSGGMLKKLDEIKSLLQTTKPGYCVQITSPENVLVELFTYKGFGTKIVFGYKITEYDNIDDCDTEKLFGLMETAFKKRFDREQYLQNKFKKIFIEEDYAGAAIITEYDRICYLDKIMVDENSRTFGLGTKLFNEVFDYAREHGGKLFWRTKTTNPAYNWYQQKILQYSGGCQVTENWVIFWIGDIADKEAIIEYAVNKE